MLPVSFCPNPIDRVQRLRYFAFYLDKGVHYFAAMHTIAATEIKKSTEM
jgi:hypothetical protein